MPEPENRPILSVVVPCYNETENISDLWARMSKICREVAGDSFEVIFVNDGSKDDTWTRIKELAEDNPAVIGVDLSRNYGHQMALTAGLQTCAGDRVLLIDADLQDPPELLPEMMKAMDEQEADVVYGKRTEREGESIMKRATAALFYRFLSKLTDIDIPLDAGDFRLMNRRTVETFLAMPEEHRFVRGMVSWLGFTQIPIPYRRAIRAHGTTSYPLTKMINFALDGITGFTIRPLRLALYVGGLFIAIAAIMAIWVVYSYLIDHTVAGWSSIMVTVLTMGALQMIFLGLIGEYVGRAYMEVKRRPLYIIRQIHGGNRGVEPPAGVSGAQSRHPPGR